jgi:outer membrane protein TolC
MVAHRWARIAGPRIRGPPRGHPPRTPFVTSPGSPIRDAFACLLLATAGSCRSPAEHRESADREVYELLERRREALGFDLGAGSGATETRFSIEPETERLRERLLAGVDLEPLALVDVLAIAAENSRDYQQEKEDLYLSALDLTLERFRFAVQRRGNVGALLSGDGDGATGASVSPSAGFTKVLGTGAAIVGDLGLGLARSLTSSDGWDLTSDFRLAITQPLLRGFGERIVKEPLTQAERQVVYQVRDFERFRRTFAVEVASQYFGILQQADQVANERANMDNLELLRQRNEELATAGRLSDIQVDQARQDELRSKTRLIEAEERLGAQLDQFKLFLGLPIGAELDLDTSELETLEIPEEIEVTEDEAIAAALALRLDYATQLDRIDDAERRRDIAADDLRAALDVTTEVRAVSEEGRPLDFDDSDRDWTLGLALDLPIDRLAERNAYRESLITLDRTRRNAEEFADQIRADLRDSLRQAATRLESLRIQQGAVQLAERRVESTNLNLEAGRADTRDILEAQEALREARDALTAARIDHYLSQLALWRDMELLRLEEDGIRLAPIEDAALTEGVGPEPAGTR